MPTPSSVRAPIEVPFDTTQDYHLEGLPIGTRGGLVVHHNFPADGEYVLSGRLVRGVEEGYHGVEGHDRPHEFLVLVDGEVVHSSLIGTKEDHELSRRRRVQRCRFRRRRQDDLAPCPDYGWAA